MLGWGLPLQRYTGIKLNSRSLYKLLAPWINRICTVLLSPLPQTPSKKVDLLFSNGFNYSFIHVTSDYYCNIGMRVEVWPSTAHAHLRWPIRPLSCIWLRTIFGKVFTDRADGHPGASSPETFPRSCLTLNRKVNPATATTNPNRHLVVGLPLLPPYKSHT